MSFKINTLGMVFHNGCSSIHYAPLSNELCIFEFYPKAKIKCKAKIRYSGSNQNNPFQKYILWKVQNCYLTGTVWFNLFEGDQYILDTTIWNAWIDEELGKFLMNFFLSWSWNVISEINRKKFMEIRTWNCFFFFSWIE